MERQTASAEQIRLEIEATVVRVVSGTQARHKLRRQ